MTANYTRSDSLPSSPASTTAPVDFMDEHTPSESDNDIDRLLDSLWVLYTILENM